MPFPSAPTQFETYIDYNSKREWIWDGYKWSLVDKAFYQNRGPIGAVGATGSTGPKGATGLPGLQGATGSDGPDGDLGATGATGPRGQQGDEGERGGAYCQLVIEPPSEGKVRGAMYLSSWNEVYVAIG